MPGIFHLFHHQHILVLVCRILNAYPSPGGPPTQNQPSISIHNWRRLVAECPQWVCFISSNHHQSNFSFPTEPPVVPQGNNASLVLPRHPRQSPNPFTYTTRRLNMCVVLSTTASFFLWVSPRSEDGYFSGIRRVGVDGL